MVSSILSPLSILLSHPPIPPFISGNLCMTGNGRNGSFPHSSVLFLRRFSLRTERENGTSLSIVFYLVFKLMGQFTDVEVRSSRGRADAVVRTLQYIYVFEFKLNGTAEEALQQIDDKGYLIPYQADGRKLIKIGVEFSAEKRNLNRWLTE